MQSTNVPFGTRNPRGHSSAEVEAALKGEAVYTTYDRLTEEDGVTLRVVDQGEAIFLDLITSIDYYLRLFTNDVEDGLGASAKELLTEADFTEASFTGYAAKTLTGGSWTSASGAPASAAYAEQAFISTVSQSGQDLYGYYVTRVSDGSLCWYQYFMSPVTIAGADEFIIVNPRLTMKDTGD